MRLRSRLSIRSQDAGGREARGPVSQEAQFLNRPSLRACKLIHEVCNHHEKQKPAVPIRPLKFDFSDPILRELRNSAARVERNLQLLNHQIVIGVNTDIGSDVQAFADNFFG